MKFKPMTTIFFAFTVLIVIVLGLAAMQPATFRYERSALMDATPAAVFEQVNNLENYMDWSPWVQMEPDAKMTLKGPVSGKGAAVDWEGKKTGAGTMTITESRPNELLQYRLDFRKPFSSTATAEFTMKPEDGKTLVTWSMFGDNNFLGKLISLVMNCEKMIGDQFDQGLANIKAIVEKK